MRRLLWPFLLGMLACSDVQTRQFADGLFVSNAHPPMRMRIADGFEYLGPETFLLGTTHEAERHHWVTANEDRITAMIVIQFERILDGVAGQYEFDVPPEQYIAGSNYRFAPDPVPFGGHTWLHNTWAFDTHASASENPGRESDRTIKLLAANNYEIDAGLIMARFVRAVGKDIRREVILFYMEPLARHGHDISDFPEGGPPSEAFDKVSAAVVARAHQAFSFLPEEASGD